MKATADTITDEQISALRLAVRAERKALNIKTATYDNFLRLDHAEHQCLVALGEKRASRGFSRTQARARCAEIINARSIDDGHIRDCGNGGDDPRDCSPACVKARRSEGAG
jgi:hypothetical protein